MIASHSSGAVSSLPRATLWQRLVRLLPVLLPLVLLVGTGLRGLDFGVHWDERLYQIGPVKRMVTSGKLLPGFYHYPSFDYWVNYGVLGIKSAAAEFAEGKVTQGLLRMLDSPSYHLGLRATYLVLSSLTLVWVYLLVLQRRRSWVEALLAAAMLACSWEVAYHLRWVATDGILMQFAALTALFSLKALASPNYRWLLAAAAAAGGGFGTKYPGGALLLPVVLAALLGARERTWWTRAVRLLLVLAVFSGVSVAVTPAIILQPQMVMRDVLHVLHAYDAGHGGHAVQAGLGHAWRMLVYLSTVFFSPHAPIAVALFGLTVLGLINILTRDGRWGVVLLSFPLFYLIYFSRQNTMIVRNLLAVAPFLAIAAARGGIVLAGWLGRSREYARRPMWSGSSAIRAACVAVLVVALGANAVWLVQAAETIVDRRTDRFLREAAAYIARHDDTTFLLSSRIQADLDALGVQPAQTTENLAEADSVVLYAREGMRRWQEWPANRPGLTQAWFGPREVNFDIYPSWWGDDRIVVMDGRTAEEIHLKIAGTLPNATTPSPGAASARTRPSGANGPSTKSARPPWVLPAVDPCTLVTADEARALIGPLAQGPYSGGWELDGVACTYVSEDSAVVSIAVITLDAFTFEEQDAGSEAVPNLGKGAYIARGGDFGGVRLFVRSAQSAVVVHVTRHEAPETDNVAMAGRLALIALARIDGTEVPR